MGHLVIGLGGTGFKALCMLKAALQAGTPAGVLPTGVALRAVDAEEPDKALRDKLSEIIGYGGVPLDRDEEYIWLGENDPPIGANLQPVALALERGGLPRGITGEIQRVPVSHITSWFQATTLINVLDAGNWNVSIGASQQRQIARLALFWNVQTPNVSPFHRKISAGIQQALTGNDLQLTLIGSTVGGTGAGLFVDVAYLVRKLVPDGAACTVTAFLLLPKAFAGVGQLQDQAFNDAQARTYACLREMEHFTFGLMTQTQGFRIIYNPGSPLAQYRGDRGTRQKLLDAVYYLDGANHLGNIVPEDGVIPLVADVALALLSETGTTRQTHMTNVVTTFRGGGGPQAGAGAQAIAQFLAKDNFSSGVGSYTIVLPMARIVDALSWRLVKEAASLLAEPGEQAGTLNQNRPGGAGGGSEVTSFCDVGPITGRHRNPITQVEESLSAGYTDLLQDIRTQGEAYGDGANALQAEGVARQFEERTPASWAAKLLLRATDKADAAKAAWEGELGKNFVSDDPSKRVMVPVTIKGEDNRAAWRRVRTKVDQEFVNILGTEQAAGTFSGGTLQGLLNGMKVELLQILRRRLWLKTLNILNGQTPAGDQVDLIRQQRGNSLGYLYAFLAAFRQLLGSYERGLRAGQAKRNRQGGKAERIQRSHADACNDGDRNPTPGILGSGAEGLRRRLLDAAQELLDLRRTEQIEGMVLDLVGTMLQDVASLQKSILRDREGAAGWGEILAVGGDASVVSIAETERLRAEQAGQGHGSPVREIIWDTDYNENLYRQYGGKGAAGVVGALDWWLLQPGEQGSAGFSLQLWMGTTRIADASGVKSRMVQRARQTFDLAWQQESVLQYMANRSTAQLWAPPTVAARLQAKSPLALAAGGVGQESMYLVVPAATDRVTTDYRKELVEAVQGVPADKLKPDYVGSNRFRLTFIRWRDLVGVKNMPSFAEAGGYYANYWSKYQFPDPRLPQRLTAETLQALPGEVEAVGIEALLPQVTVQPPLEQRMLDHEVVQQLEDMSHLRRFINAWTWGVITERQHDLESQPVTVFGFDLAEVREGPQVKRRAQEWWLTHPDQHSFLYALWDWDYEWVDKHPGRSDEKGRPRPNPGNLSEAIFAELASETDKARKRSLDNWIAANPKWQTKADRSEQAIFAKLPAARQQRAALRWAEAMYIQSKLDELRLRELKATEPKEKDTIATLMVLLWQNVRDAVKAWSTELASQ